MSWWGKLVGGAFGFVVGGPIGAILGATLGHQFDVGLHRLQEPPQGTSGQERIQTAFFTATFSVMGHLAKADGRVSEEEIGWAEHVMAQMDLLTEHRRLAMNLFREGKRPGFPLDDVLDQLRSECRWQRNLLQMFVEIQLAAGYADGSLAPVERRLLLHICERLGFSRFDFERLDAMARAERHFAGGAHRPAAPPRGPSLDDAYALLGLSATAEDPEVKRAYRRLMSQHHPDKLVSKGLPEEMIAVATRKTQEIKAAYDQIRRARGI